MDDVLMSNAPVISLREGLTEITSHNINQHITGAILQESSEIRTIGKNVNQRRANLSKAFSIDRLMEQHAWFGSL